MSKASLSYPVAKLEIEPARPAHFLAAQIGAEMLGRNFGRRSELLALAVLAALVASPAVASPFSFMGQGTETCGAWVFGNAADDVLGTQWVLGYWSGLNAAKLAHVGHTLADGFGASGEIKRVCLFHPSMTVIEAASQVYGEFLRAGK